MDKRTGWVAGLLAVIVAVTLAPGVATAQNQGGTYSQTDPPPYPPLNDRLPDGGLFIAGEYVMYRQTNPLKPQVLAVNGFTSTLPPPTGVADVGAFIGNGNTRLDVQEVTGEEFAPGFKIDVGYKFQDGSAISLNYLKLFNATKTAGATFANPGLNEGTELENSFLSAPVFNFPQEFSGPTKITNAAGNPVPGAAVGLWNGFSETSEKFETKTEIWNVVYRLTPYYETETCRWTGSFGGRYFRIHDQFSWDVIDIDVTTGVGGGQNEADYTNIASNNLWGVTINQCWEQYLGNGFGFMLDIGAAASVDIVRERTKYELGLRFTGPEGKLSRSDYTFAPELDGDIALTWYPYQSVQVKLGYNVMAPFNTVGSQNPVSFDFAAPDAKFNRIPVRVFDGWDFGFALVF